MQKNKRMMTTKTMVYCALLAALSVVLARLFSIMPEESARFSIESVPIFIAGMLFGPVAGGMVGFTADFVGCMFSPFGYNPIFCIPPILYGLCGGLFRPMLKKTEIWRIALAFLPAIVIGSIFIQSGALAIAFGGEAKEAYFYVKLTERSIQFAVTYVLDVAIVYLLAKSPVFAKAGLR